MSYWIYRDLEGNALGVEDEKPPEGVIQNGGGAWIADVRFTDGRYEYYKITNTTEHPTPGERTHVYQLMGTIHPITKDQYETYKEFGLFSDE